MLTRFRFQGSMLEKVQLETTHFLRGYRFFSSQYLNASLPQHNDTRDDTVDIGKVLILKTSLARKIRSKKEHYVQEVGFSKLREEMIPLSSS